MVAKKNAVSESEKKLVLGALSNQMTPHEGLEAVQVGWRCGKLGTPWAETVLECLLSERKVLKVPLTVNHSGRESSVTVWRLP